MCCIGSISTQPSLFRISVSICCVWCVGTAAAKKQMAEIASNWSGILLGTTSKASYQRIARTFNVLSKQTAQQDRHLPRLPSVREATISRDQLVCQVAPEFQQSSRATTTYSIMIGKLTFKSAATILVTNIIVDGQFEDWELLNWFGNLLLENGCTVCAEALESRRKTTGLAKQLLHIRVGFRNPLEAELAAISLKSKTNTDGIQSCSISYTALPSTYSAFSSVPFSA
jgi:hypothetical protein